MSEQSTSEPNVIAPGPKVKDPRRVAAGKRLAAISKQGKETKRLERESQQISETRTDNNKTLYLVGGLVVVGAVSYFLLTNKEKVVRTLTGDKEESDSVSEQEPTPKKESFKSVFDD